MTTPPSVHGATGRPAGRMWAVPTQGERAVDPAAEPATGPATEPAIDSATEPVIDSATDRELRRMALIHRRSMRAVRPAARRPR